MKRVHSATNLPEAHLLVGLLAQHGIAARIFNANASSLAGEIPVDQARPQVWVDDPRDHERALALVDDYLKAKPWAPPRKCGSCGEENPASFEVLGVWSGARLMARLALAVAALLVASLPHTAAQEKAASSQAAYVGKLLRDAPPDDNELLLAAEVLRLAGWSGNAEAPRRFAERRLLARVSGAAAPRYATLEAALRAETQRGHVAAGELLEFRRLVLDGSVTLLPGDPAAPFTRSFRNESRAPIKAAKVFIMGDGGLFLECHMEELTGGKDPIAPGGVGTLRCYKRAEEDAWRRLEQAMHPLVPDRVFTKSSITHLHFAAPAFSLKPDGIWAEGSLTREADARLAKAAPPESSRPGWSAATATQATTAPPELSRLPIHPDSAYLQALLSRPVSLDVEELLVQAGLFRLADLDVQMARPIEGIAEQLVLARILERPPPELPATLADAIKSRPPDLEPLRRILREQAVEFAPQTAEPGATYDARLRFRNRTADQITRFAGTLELAPGVHLQCHYGGSQQPAIPPDGVVTAACRTSEGRYAPEVVLALIGKAAASFAPAEITFATGSYLLRAHHARVGERDNMARHRLAELAPAQVRAPGAPPPRTAAQMEADMLRVYLIALGSPIALGLLVGVPIGARAARPAVTARAVLLAVAVIAFFAIAVVGLPFGGLNMGNLEGQVGAILLGVGFLAGLVMAFLAWGLFAIGVIAGGLFGTAFRKRRAPSAGDGAQGVPMKR